MVLHAAMPPKSGTSRCQLTAQQLHFFLSGFSPGFSPAAFLRRSSSVSLRHASKQICNGRSATIAVMTQAIRTAMCTLARMPHAVCPATHARGQTSLQAQAGAKTSKRSSAHAARREHACPFVRTHKERGKRETETTKLLFLNMPTDRASSFCLPFRVEG